jgi:hypothetical protein
MARTGIPGQLEYFVAYAITATIAIAGYGRRGAVRIIGLFLDIRRHSGVLPHFPRAGIRRSRISRQRRAERSSPGSPQPTSCAACGRAHIRTPSDLMATMFPSVKMDGALIEVVPDRSTCLDIFIRRLKCCLAAFSMLMVGLLPLGAAAQVTQPLLPNAVPPSLPQALAPPGEQPISAGQTVIDRARPEFDPIGLRLGDFFFFPHAELDESYNSNVFATNTSPTYDLLTALQPGFDLLSIRPRNALSLHGSSLLQVYADHPAQNTQDGLVNLDGRLDVTAGSSIYGNAQVSHRHISYGSPNSPGNIAQQVIAQPVVAQQVIAQPVTYWDYIARAGYMQGGRRFSYQVDVGVEAAQYNAAPLVGGGVLPQSSQDTTISDAALRASYEIVPDYLGYIRVGNTLSNYWHAVPNNSSTYRVDLGLQILPRHLVYGQVYAGYLVQNFAQSGLGSTSAPDYGGQLVWNVTGLTTLTFNGLRAFYTGTPSSSTSQVTGPAGNGYLASTIAVNADHELLRNLLLNVNASLENDSFQGITRTDNFFTAGAGFKYLINRNFFLGGSFSYQQRSSSVAGASYTQNVLTLRLGTQF